MPEGAVGLGRVQVRRPISASSAIAASSSCARRAPLQTWPQAKVGTWTRRGEKSPSETAKSELKRYAGVSTTS